MQTHTPTLPAARPALDRILLQALSERSGELEEHDERVCELAVDVAYILGLSADERADVAAAARLHDIGKLAIPASILDKDGPLSDDEWDIMRLHTIIGERLLGTGPEASAVSGMVRSSHERYGGGGYPDGLAGTRIPLGARIVTACDAYDAMVSDRVYRKGMPQAEAVRELRRCAHTQFDPSVVEALITVLAGK